MKPQIYKVGHIWVVWVPGVRVYRFDSWERALNHVLVNQVLNTPVREVPQLAMHATA